MKRLPVVLCVIALLLTATPASGQVPGQAAGGLASDDVEFVARVPEPGAFGGRILEDTLYMTTTQGLRIYDLSLGIPVIQGAINIPHFGNEDIDTNGEIALISTDHGLGFPSMLYVIDVSNPNLPMLVSSLRFSGTRAHTASCILDCRYAWVAGSSHVGVVDLSDPADPEMVGRFYRDGTPNSDAGGFGTSHDVNVDDAGIVWVSSGAGLFGYDPSTPAFAGANPAINPAPVAREGLRLDNDFIIHNSLRPDAAKPTATDLADGDIDPGEVVYVTEEDWISVGNGLCAQDGSFQTGWYHTVDGRGVVDLLDTTNVGNLDINEATSEKLQPIATCSSHWFDIRDDGVAAVAWYEQGIRFFDVSDPREIRTIGYFVPADTTASAVLYHNGYVYTFDLVRGMDVLRFNGTAGDATVAEPPLREATFELVEPDQTFGYACSIPARVT